MRTVLGWMVNPALSSEKYLSEEPFFDDMDLLIMFYIKWKLFGLYYELKHVQIALFYLFLGRILFRKWSFL